MKLFCVFIIMGAISFTSCNRRVKTTSDASSELGMKIKSANKLSFTDAYDLEFAPILRHLF
jgi:hypothetical protein